MKFPLGRVDKTCEEGVPNLDLQPGTGSVDLIGNVAYLLKCKKVGMYTNVNYNSYNLDNYKYGNTSNLTLNTFFQTNGNNISFMPIIDTYIEMLSFDKSRYEQLENKIVINHKNTGGNIYFINLGMKVFKGSLS